MLEFLARIAAVILENADVFETLVALEVLDALRSEAEKLFDLAVTRVPQMAIVARILYQQLVRSDRAHAIVKPVTPASRLTFNVIKRRRVNHGLGRPGKPVSARASGNHLRGGGGIRTKAAERLRTLADL